MIKHLGSKKNKSQFEKLLERFEEDGFQNFFNNKSLTLEEKDCILKISSFLEDKFPNLDFRTDKRPPLNQSIELENPRGRSFKVLVDLY